MESDKKTIKEFLQEKYGDEEYTWSGEPDFKLNLSDIEKLIKEYIELMGLKMRL